MTLNQFVDSHISRSTDQTTVDVFPLQCGVGKSSYIRHALQQALFNGAGLIIVTDKIAGLHSYTKSNRVEDAETVEYIEANEKRIATLTADTVKSEYKNLFTKSGKSVVLMTTQRFFNLECEQILQLTDGVIKRKVIVFDEKPYFFTNIEISEKELNFVDTALRTAIDDTASQENKKFLIDEWERVADKVRSLFAEFESQNDSTQKIYWHDLTGAMTDDDERFLHLVNETYKSQLNSYSVNVRKFVHAVYQMFTDGATFKSQKKLRSRSKDEYRNSFEVVVDNSDKLINVGAKVFVFDGTADIDPEYGIDYVRLINCDEYKRRLHNLTINIVDVPTPKHRLLDKDNDGYLDLIAEDIKIRCGNPVVFSHKELKPKFGKTFSKYDYFGNIKGKNDYREATEIVQIGLFRFPDVIYELKTYFLKSLSSRKRKSYRIITYRAVDILRNKMLLTDIEQNLFRSNIRNADSYKPVVYTLYTSAYQPNSEGSGFEYSELVQMIINRYTNLGATVNVVDRPIKFRLLKILDRNTENPTHAQIILRWINNRNNGEVFAVRDMLIELGLTNEQFKQVKKKHKEIRNLFDSMRIDKGLYEISV